MISFQSSWPSAFGYLRSVWHANRGKHQSGPCKPWIIPASEISMIIIDTPRKVHITIAAFCICNQNFPLLHSYSPEGMARGYCKAYGQLTNDAKGAENETWVRLKSYLWDVIEHKGMNSKLNKNLRASYTHSVERVVFTRSVIYESVIKNWISLITLELFIIYRNEMDSISIR